MVKLNKLDLTFVRGTEATAESQNTQNAKINEIIEKFTLDSGDIALPVEASNGEQKYVTKLGTNLSVSGNTLNAASYTLPLASSTILGGIKVGTGLSMSNGVLSVSGNTGGGVSESKVNELITEAINDLDVSDSAVSGKYVSKVSQTNGKVAITRADLPTPTMSLSSGTYTLKYNGDNVGLEISNPSNALSTLKVTSGNSSNTYVLMKSGTTNIYKSIAGTQVSSGAFDNQVQVENADVLYIYIPLNKSINKITDAMGKQVQDSFIDHGIAIVNNAFYKVFAKQKADLKFSNTYTITYA